MLANDLVSFLLNLFNLGRERGVYFNQIPRSDLFQDLTYSIITKWLIWAIVSI
jgi:hypothetical protein